jgi:flagellar basal-body rod protein FlgG
MGQIIDLVSRILTQSERSAEIAGQNISNVTTPGYKRHVEFSTLLENAGLEKRAVESPRSVVRNDGTDFSTGKAVETGGGFDLSLAGPGFFVVRTDDGIFYTRKGQLQRAADGRVTTGEGQTVQLEGGGDLVLRGADLTVTADGVVIENGEPLGRLAIMDAADPAVFSRTQSGLFSAPEGDLHAVTDPVVRQGVLEASNVSMGDEMLTIMQALRRAETGQRLANVYDDLMGRAVTSFGQS